MGQHTTISARIVRCCMHFSVMMLLAAALHDGVTRNRAAAEPSVSPASPPAAQIHRSYSRRVKSTSIGLRQRAAAAIVVSGPPLATAHNADITSKMACLPLLLSKE